MTEGRRVMKRTTMMVLLAGALATALVAWSATRGAHVAQAQEPPTVGVPNASNGAAPPPVDVGGEVLAETEMRTAAEGHTISCAGSCLTDTPMFIPGTLAVVCPGLAGDTCTYQITLQAHVSVTNNTNGLFRFLIDGVAPAPGPTDGAGFFTWSLGNATSGALQARGYAVTAQVTNNVDMQAHVIDIRVGCQAGAGCTAQSGFANARIDVYQP